MCLIHEDGVVDRNRELDVSWMPRTSCLVQVARRAPREMIRSQITTMHTNETHGESPHDPRAGS